MRLLAAALAGLLAAPAAGPARRASCQLLVNNKTPYRVLIHVDGVYWGWVSAQRSFVFKGVPRGKVLLYGATQYGEFFWGPKGLVCEDSATWDLGF